MIIDENVLNDESPYFQNHIEQIFHNFKGKILILNELSENVAIIERIMSNCYFNEDFAFEIADLSSYLNTLNKFEKEDKQILRIIDKAAEAQGASISHSTKLDIEIALSNKSHTIRDEIIFTTVKDKIDACDIVFIFNGKDSAAKKSFQKYSVLMVESIQYAIRKKKFIVFNDYESALDINMNEEEPYK